MNKDNYPDNMPTQFKPIRPWGYVGYFWLFAIPIVGLIFMIIYACDEENINRRNLARGYLWNMLIGFIIGMLISSLMLVTMGTLLFNNSQSIVKESTRTLNSYKATAYNSIYEMYLGENCNSSRAKSLIEMVKAHNTNDYEVEEYGKIELGGECTTASDIISSKRYDISAEYNSDGYIDTIIIDEVR